MKNTIALLIVILFPCIVFAQQTKTEITAPVLQWIPGTKTYHLIGGVKIIQDNKLLRAEEIFFHSETNEAHAIGNVFYKDPNVEIHAEEATLNINKDTGQLKNGKLYFLRGNYKLKATLLIRLSEKHYQGRKISYTTCTGKLPFWCLKASKADLIIGKKITATNVRLNILGVPVFYTPYLWAPVLTDRTTGFLPPRIGYNSDRGLQLELPFYLVISENRDATFYLQWAERAMGEAMEYRYIERNIGRGRWFFYRFDDRTKDRVFYLLEAAHRLDSSYGVGGFLSLNYLSEKDYYRLYSYKIELLTSRFTASTTELYYRKRSYKISLRARYWQNLSTEQEPIQHIPVASLLIYPHQIGNFLLGLKTESARFYQKKGIEAFRLTIIPYLYNSLGENIKLQQSVEPYVAYYSLNNNQSIVKNTYGLTYRATLGNTFYIQHKNFLHTLRPEITYEYRKISNLPEEHVFDEQEIDINISRILTALVQRFYLNNTHIGAIKFSHLYDLKENSYSQLVIEGYKTGRFHLKFDFYYDLKTSTTQKYHYSIGMDLSRIALSVGESYSVEPKIRNYQASIKLLPFHWLILHTSLWYDQRHGKFTKITYGGKIDGQCIALNITYSKTQTQYSIFMLLTFKGLGEVKYGEML